MVMKKYEYCVKIFNHVPMNVTEPGNVISNQLNILSAEGWRVIDVQSFKFGETPAFCYTLEREK